eukprot:RCo010654
MAEEFSALSRGGPTARALHEVSQAFIAQLRDDYTAQQERHRSRHGGGSAPLSFTWNNRGEITKRFFRMMDTLRGYHAELPQGRRAKQDLRELFMVFAGYLLSSSGVPAESFPLKKFDTKFKDWEHGGTRYTEGGEHHVRNVVVTEDYVVVEAETRKEVAPGPLRSRRHHHGHHHRHGHGKSSGGKKPKKRAKAVEDSSSSSEGEEADKHPSSRRARVSLKQMREKDRELKLNRMSSAEIEQHLAKMLVPEGGSGGGQDGPGASSSLSAQGNGGEGAAVVVPEASAEAFAELFPRLEEGAPAPLRLRMVSALLGSSAAVLRAFE